MPLTTAAAGAIEVRNIGCRQPAAVLLEAYFYICPGLCRCGLNLIQSAHAAESAVVTQLMLKELADIPEKEMLMIITVDYPPGR